jgi:hypothetical protein
MKLSNEVVVGLGWFIGQLITTTVALMVLQQRLNNNPQKGEIGFWKACGIYYEKETGNIVLGIAGLFALLFVMPDFWDSDINRMDLKIKSTLTWKERIQYYQRGSALAFGALIQLILILGLKKGQKAVEKAAG